MDDEAPPKVEHQVSRGGWSKGGKVVDAVHRFIAKEWKEERIPEGWSQAVVWPITGESRF